MHHVPNSTEWQEPMSKQRNTPLMDWWLRKWQLMLYTVRRCMNGFVWLQFCALQEQKQRNWILVIVELRVYSTLYLV